jgi:hypothetical protein
MATLVRKMVRGKQKLKVAAIHVTRNGWEYFQEGGADSDGIAFGLVCGFEDELGSFSIEEIAPYVTATAEGDNLKDCLPAPGWRWDGWDFED